MPQTPEPLNWPALVAEALRRRKAEGLTQKQHAALAGVSVPTMAAFDRGETSLSLGKAFDILRVIGLLDEREAPDPQGQFVHAALRRWQELIDGAPTDAAARLPFGHYRFDYWLDGDLKRLDPTRFALVLRDRIPRHTVWPVFRFPGQGAAAVHEHDGLLEYWDGGSAVNQPAHCDFWRAAPDPRLLILRGYEEDSQETFAPGTIFDISLPAWRIGETLLHAAALARNLAKGDPATIRIHFRAVYTGLKGRQLRAWANPRRSLWVEGMPARSDEAVIEAIVPAGSMEERLNDHVFPMLVPLFERFGFVDLEPAAFAPELHRLLSSQR